MTTDNGILALVPGPFISEGSQRLPAAGPDQEGRPDQAVLIWGVPDLGTVRITYRLNTYRHRRTVHWHWMAVRAERADGAEAGSDLH